MTRNPSLRYQLREYRTGCLILLLVNILLFGIFRILVQCLDGGEATLNGSCFTYLVFMFVIGIVIPRPFLRLSIQLGVSRRTTFRSALVSAAIAALVLALFDELLVILFQATACPNYRVSNLYALLYTGSSAPLTFPQHIASLLLSFCLMVFCWTAGCFFTFLFWRLNALGCVIAGVSIPVILVGLPCLFIPFGEQLAPVSRCLERLALLCLGSPWAAMALCLILAVFLALVNWLLVRQVNIRGSALK